jgi:hypothetical protein
MGVATSDRFVYMIKTAQLFPTDCRSTYVWLISSKWLCNPDQPCSDFVVKQDPHVLAHVRIRHTQICGALNSALFDLGLWHVVWEWQLGLQYREACKGNMFNLVLRTIWWSGTWIHNRLMPMACEECCCDWANLCIDNHYFHNLIFRDKSSGGM